MMDYDWRSVRRGKAYVSVEAVVVSVVDEVDVPVVEVSVVLVEVLLITELVFRSAFGYEKAMPTFQSRQWL